MKRILKCLLSIMLMLGSVGTTLSLSGCNRQQQTTIKAEDVPVIHELEFGGAYIEMTIEAFNELGFAFGDSVDVRFSNGYQLKDIPYYNGYYVANCEPLVVGYPGYPHVKVCYNNWDDLWELAKLDETMTATITLNTRGKYLDVQQARDLHYQDDRMLFPSDEVFANFRAIAVDAVKPDTVYRSASPCDNQHNRAPYVDSLIAAAGVRFILNLADTHEKIKGYMSAEGFNCPYFSSLYEAGSVEPIALTMNFASADFKTKLVHGLSVMAEHEGPYLVHCTEGKDRTGFVCMLLEALCGTSYQQIEQDYMITYDNYYQLNKQQQPEKYAIIVEDVLVPMIQSLAGDESLDVTKADLAYYAEQFLLAAGMSEQTLSQLKTRIQK